MRVKVIRAFVAKHDNKRYAGNVGQILEMPEGADWIRAKFVEPVIDAVAAETAAIEPTETAAKPKAKKVKG